MASALKELVKAAAEDDHEGIYAKQLSLNDNVEGNQSTNLAYDQIKQMAREYESDESARILIGEHLKALLLEQLITSSNNQEEIDRLTSSEFQEKFQESFANEWDELFKCDTNEKDTPADEEQESSRSENVNTLSFEKAVETLYNRYTTNINDNEDNADKKEEKEGDKCGSSVNIIKRLLTKFYPA